MMKKRLKECWPNLRSRQVKSGWNSMNPLHYQLVFSVVDNGYKSWWFPALGVAFALFGSVFVPFILIAKYPDIERKKIIMITSCFLGFSGVWILIALVGTLGDYLHARQTLLSGQAQYVEGDVEHFVPMPYGGHAVESFDVKGIAFSYSDFVIISGFNNTSSHGGPIREGLPVHIWYSGNEILKLEVGQE
jgi:hypothetical protein